MGRPCNTREIAERVNVILNKTSQCQQTPQDGKDSIKMNLREMGFWDAKCMFDTERGPVLNFCVNDLERSVCTSTEISTK